MLDPRFLWSAKRGLSRAAMGVVLAFWCAFALASADARAICLSRGGECSPSALVAEGSCHEQAADTGANPDCNSCVDVLLHGDASASGSRSDRELPAPAVTQLPASVAHAANTPGDAPAAFPTARSGSPSQYPFPRIDILRI